MDENMITIDSNLYSSYTEDYSLLVEDYLFEVNNIMNDIILETAFQELYIYELALHDSNIILEDVDVVDRKTGGGFLSKVATFFTHIMEAVRRLIAKFIQNANELFEENQEWFNENAHVFDNISESTYDRINITIIPYWNGESRLRQSVTTVVTKTVRQHSGELETKSELSDDSKLYQWAAPKLYSIDREDSQKAAKEYFRSSNEQVSIRGAKDVINKVKIMINYCRTYNNLASVIKANTAKFLNELENINNKKKAETENRAQYEKIQRKLRAKEKKENKENNSNSSSNNNTNSNDNDNKNNDGKGNNKDGKVESATDVLDLVSGMFTGQYSLLESAILLEETKSDNDDKKESTKSEVKLDSKEEYERKETAHKETMESYERMSKLLSLHQRVIGCQMSVAEECYNRYISTLKAIAANGIKVDHADKRTRKSSSEPPPKGEEKEESSLAKKIFGSMGRLFKKK